jgi:hypothetical protein
MAKPRIFVSSTYYDLKHIRSNLENFIHSFGYDSVLFERGDIPFFHENPLDESCYTEIDNCHMLVLIIGGRYGSATSSEKKADDNTLPEKFNSITKREYETAREKDIPIFIFVEKNVMAEYYTYKQNRGNNSINYAHVDNINIFVLLDDILSQRRNNLTKEFENFEDISSWLRDQWAGLFAEALILKSTDKNLKDMTIKIDELSQITEAMKEYTESLMRKIQPENFEKIISEHERKIETNRIKKFAKEDLIDYLIQKSKDPDYARKEINIARAFVIMRDCDNLADFMKKIDFKKEFIDFFYINNKSAADRDYDNIKHLYFSEEEVAATTN